MIHKGTTNAMLWNCYLRSLERLVDHCGATGPIGRSVCVAWGRELGVLIVLGLGLKGLPAFALELLSSMSSLYHVHLKCKRVRKFEGANWAWQLWRRLLFAVHKMPLVTADMISKYSPSIAERYIRISALETVGTERTPVSHVGAASAHHGG